MGTPLRVLILEDDAADADLVATELIRSGFDLQWQHVTCKREFIASLAQTWDVILADFTLPQFSALRALGLLREIGSLVPLIVLTGAVGEEIAVECIKQGAADYLLKDRLARLPAAIGQALEQKRVREESAQAQRALQENEQRFRALIDHSSNGTLLLNRLGMVTHRYNDLFSGTGYQCENFLEWMIPEDRPAVGQMWGRLAQEIQTIQFRVSDASGATRFLEAVCNDLTQTAPVEAIVVHYRDVTERRQLEEQFRHSQKMEAVGQLAAGLGHDFNNLLTIMSGYSELSLRHPGLPPPVHKGLAEIQDACRRATRLTRELLAFSRKQDRQPKVLDVNRAISDLTPLLKSLLGEDLLLHFDPHDTGLVEIDEGELEQIIVNLVVNAKDALAGSGSITIETRDLPGATSPQVMLSVRDNGCGMDQAVQSRIFEPFFTTKDVGKGTGLGLSTVYAIVTNASGQISVESEVGKGTTFRVMFPRAEGAVVSDLAKLSQLHHPDARETILLVEDNDQVRELVESILRPLGYSLIQARNAVEAIDAWHSASRPIDLLFTDIRIPGTKGTELAQMLQQEKPNLKVLFMTGYAGAESSSEAKLVAGAGLLAKPFSPEVLAQRVREVLSAPVNLQTGCVLIVDDDVKIRNFLRSVLEAEGYSVHDTADGADALSKIKSQCPDLVLTDIVMPDMEGIELIRKMRSVAREIRIIAMSGSSGPYLQAALVLGADAAIQKPIAIAELLNLISTLCVPSTTPRDAARLA